MTDYQPLSDFLSSRRTNEVSLPLTEVERVLGQPLPPSARRHQAWWANTRSHSHARAWLRVGWRTARLNLGAGSVTFVRNENAGPKEDERARAPVSSPGAIMVDRAQLSKSAAGLVARRAAEMNGDEAAAVASLLDDAAVERRRSLLARFADQSPRLATDSVDLIREDRDSR